LRACFEATKKSSQDLFHHEDTLKGVNSVG